MTAQWIWILCLNCLVKPIKASILIQARGEKKPYPITHCPVSFYSNTGISLDNGWKGYQRREKRWFLTEMGLKADYATCVENSKPLPKDNNCCAPPEANEQDLQDRCHPSLKMFRNQGRYGFRGSHSSSGLQEVEQRLASQGSSVPAGAGVAQAASHGSVPSLQIAHSAGTLRHARQNPHCCALPFCITCSQSDSWVI